MCEERINDCLLQRSAERTWRYKVDQINAQPTGNWSRLARKKIDMQTVHGSPVLFTLSSDYFTKEGLQGFGDSKIRQVIRTAKYTHDLVLLAKEERVIQGMTDGLTETGRWYRMEMNVEKARAIRISLHPSTDYERSKKTGECGILQLLRVAQLITQDVQVKLSPGLQW